MASAILRRRPLQLTLRGRASGIVLPSAQQELRASQCRWESTSSLLPWTGPVHGTRATGVDRPCHSAAAFPVESFLDATRSSRQSQCDSSYAHQLHRLTSLLQWVSRSVESTRPVSSSSSNPFSGKPRSALSLPFAVSAAAAAGAALALGLTCAQCEEDDVQGEVVTNWSATHRVVAKVVHRPETLEELENIVADAHSSGQRIRPVGSGISPNGLGLSAHGMVNLGLMDQVLRVDQSTGQVTVQAGARVEQVVEALRPLGLTLQNYASVREQQIGGFIQVGAHGTGARIPPVDEQVLGLKLVTPAKGSLSLTPETDPELFFFARCGLGALGVVAEVTLQAVPAYLLFEETFVTDLATIRKHHRDWLCKYKHIRYMWIPNTDTIVVVRSNPLPDPSTSSLADRAQAQVPQSEAAQSNAAQSKVPGSKAAQSRLAATRAAAAPPSPRSLSLFHGLLCSSIPALAAKARGLGEPAEEEARALYLTSTLADHVVSAPLLVQQQQHHLLGGKPPLSEQQLRELSFTELRDELLALQPLDARHVALVNAAEAAYWHKTQGARVGWSDQILGFDCGGQQWVSEVCFPVPWSPTGKPASQSAAGQSAASQSAGSQSSGSQPGESGAAREDDLDYVVAIMKLIEQESIPAPAPLEQRWSCGSRSPMSPASVGIEGDIGSLLTSWVGIILYLPTSDASQRQAITDRFMQYKDRTARLLWEQYNAHEHWAKIEVPDEQTALQGMKHRLAKRFPLDRFAELRRELDPKGIMSNDMLDELLS